MTACVEALSDLDWTQDPLTIPTGTWCYDPEMPPLRSGFLVFREILLGFSCSRFPYCFYINGGSEQDPFSGLGKHGHKRILGAARIDRGPSSPKRPPTAGSHHLSRLSLRLTGLLNPVWHLAGSLTYMFLTRSRTLYQTRLRKPDYLQADMIPLSLGIPFWASDPLTIKAGTLKKGYGMRIQVRDG